MTGPSAQIGIDAKVAFETAAEIINGAFDLDLPTARSAGLAGLGGATVRVIVADHQANPEEGVQTPSASSRRTRSRLSSGLSSRLSP